MADPALLALANLLKQTQHRRVEENRPATSPAYQMPQGGLPPYQQPGMSLDPAAYISSPAPAIPRPGAVAPMAPPAAIPGGAPQVASAAPPMPPGNEPMPLDPNVMQSTSSIDNRIANKPESVWETMKRLFANGQVPEGYRGAMGEMIKNA
jgi:hypothetical protein